MMQVTASCLQHLTSQAATPLLDGTVNLIAGEILQVDVDLLYRDSTLGVPVRRKSRGVCAAEN